VRASTPSSLRRDLRYGENPHQKAVWIHGRSGLSTPWTIHQGKELSYTNLLDLDAAVRIALEFTEPAAVVIKHTNPCGVATGSSAADAYVRAREADPLSAFGGIVGLNRPLDAEVARAITSTFIEAVLAPALDGEAKDILAAKPNMRVVTASLEALRTLPTGGDFGLGGEVRSFLGGVLTQERDQVTEAREPWPNESAASIRVVTKRQPTPEEWTALRFATLTLMSKAFARRAMALPIWP